MKRTLLILLLTLVPLFALKAKDYEVHGPVLILHGTSDKIVPMWCSERYKETYGDKAELKTIEGENHTITRHRDVVIREVVEFFKGL